MWVSISSQDSSASTEIGFLSSLGAIVIASSISVLHGVSVVTVASVHFDWNAYNGFCPSSSCSAESLAASVSILFNSKLL